MTDDRVIPFEREPTQLPGPLAYVTRELCAALEGMPDQFARHGLSDADVRRQAEEHGRAFADQVKAVMLNESRPGGVLYKIKKAG